MRKAARLFLGYLGYRICATVPGSQLIVTKGGNFGRWQTPHQKAKQAEQVEMGTKFSVGDAGIWVTYARGMKGKALREFRELCYGVCDPAHAFPIVMSSSNSNRS